VAKLSTDSLIRKFNKLKKDPYLFVADSQNLGFLVKIPYMRGVLQDLSASIEGVAEFDFFKKIGENWDGEVNTKKIAFLIGFKDWKMSFISYFLESYSLIQVSPQCPWYLQRKKFEFYESPTFIVWGMAGSDTLLNYINSKKSKFLRMEDGFIRSIGLGANKIPPISLVLDSKGIYYNAQSPSDLEDLMNFSEFDDEILERAGKCIEIINEYGITKYGISKSLDSRHSKTEKNAPLPSHAKRKNVLVIGQVDSDASIKYGCSEVYHNSNALLMQAFFENPNAIISYRPHPEILKKIRKNEKFFPHSSSLFNIVDKGSFDDSLKDVDVVYTLTSLSGFESLLRGKDVITVGSPFYSGWGLTEDRFKISRRNRTLNILEAFSASYIIYPIYACPFSKKHIKIEQALLTLFCMSHPVFNCFFNAESSAEYTINQSSFQFSFDGEDDFLNRRNMLDFSKKIDTNYLDSFGLMLHALCSSSAIREHLESFLSSSKKIDVGIDLFHRLFVFLRNEVRFNDIKEVVDIYTDWYSRLYRDFSCAQSSDFLDRYIFSIKKMNGRIVEADITFHVPFSSSNFEKTDLLKKYFRAFMLNCSYDKAELVIRFAFETDLQTPTAVEMLNATYEKSAKNERDGYRRDLIRGVLRDFILISLDKDHLGEINFLINRLVVSTYTKNIFEFEFVLKAIFSVIEFMSPEQLDPYADRFSKMDSMVYWIASEGRSDLAELTYKIISPFFKSSRKNRMRIEILNSRRQYEDIRLMIEKNPLLLNDRVIIGKYCRTMRGLGDFTTAIDLLKSTVGERNTLVKNRSILDQIEKISFISDSSDLINSVSLPDGKIKGIIFLSTLNCLNSLAMLAPVLCELKKKGFHIVCLTDCSIKIKKIGLSFIDQFDSIIPAELHDGEVDLDWHIDWVGKKVFCNGVNYYQGIYEQLSARFRRFHIDIEDPSIKRVFNLQIKYADLMLRVCEKISSTILDKGIPAVLLAGNSHISPYSVFRDYCLSQNNPKLRFVASNVAYENYYSNLGGKFSGSMAVVDMTLHRTCRAPFLAIKERFEKWYLDNMNDPSIESRVNLLLSANRVARENQAISPNLQKVRDAKKQGKKIVCCLGKILCDLAVPYDGGPAHSDIVDWLNHTIDAVRDNPNILLLIKPHPHELRPEIALDLVEFLRDVIPQKLPENVIFLDHKEFNVAEMAGLLDLAILWNGTSALELTIMGVPVMMCSHFGRHDYPVELIYPKSRSQYTSYLRRLKYSSPSIETGRRAAALLHYMGTPDVALPNRYSRRPITNDVVGVPVWDKIALQKYLSLGDPVIELAAERVIEGVV